MNLNKKIEDSDQYDSDFDEEECEDLEEEDSDYIDYGMEDTDNLGNSDNW